MGMITDFMAKDHDRLDNLFNRFHAAKATEIESAIRLFSEFKRGLQRHILWGEHILFPVFESRTGMEEQGPTAVMRTEHRQIKGFLEQIHDHLAKKETDTDGFEQDLVETLAKHNRKEETVLRGSTDAYPDGSRGLDNSHEGRSGGGIPSLLRIE